MRKKEKTDQNKLTFEVNERVCLQDQKTKRWDVQGVVKDVRVSEEGTILSYDIVLSNNHITSRHRRFIRSSIIRLVTLTFLRQQGWTGLKVELGSRLGK